jgi:fructose-1,6-bisphosphatase
MYSLDVHPQAKGGKRRRLCEAKPMALLIAQAGGALNAEHARILGLMPAGLHQGARLIQGARNALERLAADHAALGC